MPVPLKEWAANANDRFQNVSDRDINELWFHRDPTRPIVQDPSLLLSPADGVVLYAGVHGLDNPVEVKGTSLTTRELLDDMWIPDTPCLVIGIFMTFYNVHINRIPAKGLLYYQELSAIETENMPMLISEDKLLHDNLRGALAYTGYQKMNARTVNRLVMTEQNRELLIVQIADQEVNVVAPFTARQGWLYMQGQRFAMIRGGSQVNLIVPGVSADHLGIEVLVPPGFCVEGGEPLARLLP